MNRSNSIQSDMPNVLSEYKTAVVYKEGGDAVYRRLDCQAKLIQSEYVDLFSMLESVASYKWHSSCVGQCVLDENNEPTSEWKFETYGEFLSSVVHISSALLEIEALCPVKSFPDAGYKHATELRTIGIIMRNSCDWFRLEYAAARVGICLIPIYQTFGVQAMNSIITETKIDTIVTTTHVLLNKLVALDLPVKNFIISDSDASYHQNKSALGELKAKYSIYTIVELLYLGEKHNKPRPVLTRDDVWTICFTSGTTGQPKGAILTHGNCMSTVSATMVNCLDSDSGLKLNESDRHYSYLPLEHIFERAFSGLIIRAGNSIACFNNKVDLIFDLLKTSEATVFISVPRLFEKINQKVMELVSKKSFISQLIFNTAFKTKRQKYISYGQTGHAIYDPLIFRTVKSILGERLRFFVCGGAPLNPEIRAAMAAYFSVLMVEGYGMTESCGISAVSYSSCLTRGTVGHIVPHNEFKLDAVPELDYYPSNNQGELLLRGQAVFKGYFRNSEMTKDVLNEDGWLSTGDIVEIDADGAIHIIDRKGHCFKLSQGEFIAPEKVENVLNLGTCTQNIFVTGRRMESFLVAFVVPSDLFIEKYADGDMTQNELYKALCTEDAFRDMAQDLRKTGLSNGLHSYEIPKVMCIMTRQDVEASDIMTPTFKLKRKVLDKKMKDEIDLMYQTHEHMSFDITKARP